ncbi:hypothetical protein C7M84_014519 [Penaeus vannamei]|uniref:Uncharacterized protein n=2 Tax=Penaeus vannamei TaxID=6689 RepID=A0A423ST85_PENVA|nr:hypothetical protein C7M84_014519 [Penaeus vannamei]
MFLASALALLLLAGNTRAEGDRQPEESPSNSERSEVKEKLFFLASSTTYTVNAISSFTTVIPFTCFVSNTNACQGRKLRRMKSISGDFDKLLDKTSLDSSAAPELTLEKDTAHLGDTRKFFVVWRSTTTTHTVTSTSYNRAITVSASAYCTYVGFAEPLC